MNKIEICNMALVACGTRPIVSLTDDTSKEAETMNLLYTPTLSEVLAMHKWPSATRRTRVNLIDPIENLSDWRHQYQLPNDCITVLSFLGPMDSTELEQIPSFESPKISGTSIFEREGDTIYSNTFPGAIKYIYFPTDTAVLRPSLSQAVAMRLAFYAAVALGRDLRLSSTLQIRFEQALLRAKTAEGRDYRSDPVEQKNWSEYRGPSGRFPR